MPFFVALLTMSTPKATYYQNNKEQYNERAKKYYQEHKQEILQRNKEKITCEICNCTINRTSFNYHNRSNKHIRNMNRINNSDN